MASCPQPPPPGPQQQQQQQPILPPPDLLPEDDPQAVHMRMKRALSLPNPFGSNLGQGEHHHALET